MDGTGETMQEGRIFIDGFEPKPGAIDRMRGEFQGQKKH